MAFVGQIVPIKPMKLQIRNMNRDPTVAASIAPTYSG